MAGPRAHCTPPRPGAAAAVRGRTASDARRSPARRRPPAPGAPLHHQAGVAAVGARLRRRGGARGDLPRTATRSTRDGFAGQLRAEGVDVALAIAEYSPKATGIQPVEDMLAAGAATRRAGPADRQRQPAPAPSRSRTRCSGRSTWARWRSSCTRCTPASPPTTVRCTRPTRGARSLGVPVVVHCGTSTFPGSTNRSPTRCCSTTSCATSARLDVVLAHGGRGWWYDAAAFMALTNPHVWIELSGLPPSRLQKYYARHNWNRLARRMIFGTDWPGVPGIARNARAVAALLPDDDTVARGARRQRGARVPTDRSLTCRSTPWATPNRTSTPTRSSTRTRPSSAGDARRASPRCGRPRCCAPTSARSRSGSARRSRTAPSCTPPRSGRRWSVPVAWSGTTRTSRAAGSATVVWSAPGLDRAEPGRGRGPRRRGRSRAGARGCGGADRPRSPSGCPPGCGPAPDLRSLGAWGVEEYLRAIEMHADMRRLPDHPG